MTSVHGRASVTSHAGDRTRLMKHQGRLMSTTSFAETTITEEEGTEKAPAAQSSFSGSSKKDLSNSQL